ncbi:MAG: hypothetical protein ACOYNL_06160 [Rickettsiales bacterium]
MKKTKAVEKAVSNAPDNDTAGTGVIETTHETPLLQDPVTWIGLSFVIVLVLFVRYLLPMINKGLDARGDKIRDQLEQANRLRAEAEALLATYEAEQETMLKEAESILSAAKSDAADMRARAGDELKQALERRSQQAKEKIARAEAEAVAQIRTRIINEATDAARTMLTEQAKGKSEEQAVARAISAIEQQIH